MECYKWHVQVPMEDDEHWFTVVECETPQSVGACVAALCQENGLQPYAIKVLKSVYIKER